MTDLYRWSEVIRLTGMTAGEAAVYDRALGVIPPQERRPTVIEDLLDVIPEDEHPRTMRLNPRDLFRFKRYAAFNLTMQKRNVCVISDRTVQQGMVYVTNDRPIQFSVSGVKTT